MRQRMTLLVGTVGALALACADPPRPVDGPAPRARFLYPADGDTVGPVVPLVLAADGIPLGPAGRRRGSLGHLHVYIDADITPVDQPIPLGDPEIVHLDDGGTETTLRALAPGAHRLIVALAGGDQTRLADAATDTVHVIVLPPVP